MTRTAVVAAIAFALTLGASSAAAAYEPAAYGTATRGTLNVTSGVLVLPKVAEMKGVWLDDTRSCAETRRLRVTVEVFYSRGATTSRVRLAKTGPVANCAEGGPNFGFVVRASRHGLACPSGRWKPGSYSFLTTTRDLRSGLAASASLLWQKTGSC